jgi:hypothetical protein
LCRGSDLLSGAEGGHDLLRKPIQILKLHGEKRGLAADLLSGAAGGGAIRTDELIALRSELRIFEQIRSKERKELFGRIDALSAELVRRYREGEADIEGLLADE